MTSSPLYLCYCLQYSNMFHPISCSSGQKVLCNGLLWGPIWQPFIGRVLQFGVVPQLLIVSCVMPIRRFFCIGGYRFNSCFTFQILCLPVLVTGEID